MKLRYITPESEVLQTLLSYVLLQDSITGEYSGEDANYTEGSW